MIDALKFVQGAVATKDFVPELTHFRIASGYIIGFNGRLALCSPIDLDLNACPKATKFTRALQSCEETASLHLTPSNRLCVKSGNFKAFVECLDDVGHDAYPAGETVLKAPENLLDMLATLAPFMGEDASRPWCMGIHFNGPMAYATNNIIAVQCWTGLDLPAMTVPQNAVKELLRIKAAPTALQTDGNSLAFWYPDGRWMRTQLVTQAWPVEILSKLLDECPADLEPVPEGLFDALDRVKPFLPADSNRIFLNGDHVATHESDQDGATYSVSGIPNEVAYNIDQLLRLKPVADKMRLGSDRGYFAGNGMRGVMQAMTR